MNGVVLHGHYWMRRKRPGCYGQAVMEIATDEEAAAETARLRAEVDRLRGELGLPPVPSHGDET